MRTLGRVCRRCVNGPRDQSPILAGLVRLFYFCPHCGGGFWRNLNSGFSGDRWIIGILNLNADLRPLLGTGSNKQRQRQC